LRLQAVKGAEEVQRLVSMINAEIKEEEDQVEAQKKIDEISSSGSSGTIIDTKSDIVRDERDHFSHFIDPSPAIEHDSLFAISSPPSSFSDNVDEYAMTTNDKHIEVEVEKEVEIVPKEHVKNLNERIENRALEMLQELSLARYIHIFIYTCIYKCMYSCTYALESKDVCIYILINMSIHICTGKEKKRSSWTSRGGLK
jgi:hypothetical protein